MTGYGDGTRCVRAGVPPAAPGAPLTASPVLSSQFHVAEQADGLDVYGRSGNPTWRALETAIGELDGGECVLFSSGMAALTTLLNVLLRRGDRVLVPSDGYYLARQHLHDQLADRLDLEVVEVDTSAVWSAELVAGARLVLLESPANPGLQVCDLARVAALAHAAGATVAVDNTTATPLGQRPLALGADVVLASDTKALAGHSDVVLGHLSTTDTELVGLVTAARTATGCVPGPFEAWLAHRGLATLDLRLARQADNAAALYPVLRGHPAVRGVRWPGAAQDPAHPLAVRQMRRFGGVLCFELASADAVREFLAASRLIAQATSFGGLHSTADRRARWGDPVPPGFVRLSCGCEDPADLVADVSAALAGLPAAGA